MGSRRKNNGFTRTDRDEMGLIKIFICIIGTGSSGRKRRKIWCYSRPCGQRLIRRGRRAFLRLKTGTPSSAKKNENQIIIFIVLGNRDEVTDIAASSERPSAQMS